ncbi:hypothetical protein HER10_EVM0004411 [Colletotrichum scovillei]|uniref:Uncharacterized protein n=1 Tax=Colletotrichum scovillei TaxID=1209932 RepID=A0A9P7QRS8_9PEZI|nr:uncharacterized protein HER10_EVM0004411 [Colletotrichum scovillei]KAF4780914.1 hypothetical protein HER10_EVM0004411 [Colletotrichum scovillei]KAG7039216.1 hypothetical protein JMJ78_0005011 [Colletotrichum scovillei]KAG7041402.1 hypothetical protein JMJ77_0003508 [Colletotrichum scovillei]KAG7061429.1 hypothetical protein JMJ76_0000993 [Colletotrichum scovillei]
MESNMQQQQPTGSQASGSNASGDNMSAHGHGTQQIQQPQIENNAPDGPVADSPGHNNNMNLHDDDIQQAQQHNAQQQNAQQHHMPAPNSHPGMIPIAHDPRAQNQHQLALQVHGQAFGQNNQAHQQMPNPVGAGNPASSSQNAIMAAHGPQSLAFGHALHVQQQVYAAVGAAMAASNHNANMAAQPHQQQAPNAVGAGNPAPNIPNAMMGAQAPQPSLPGAATPMHCSKCRKNGNVAWNTRWQDPDAQSLVLKTFATCNHCKWSPRLQDESAVNWVLRNAPWLVNDVGAYCPCYVGSAGNHAHPMCLTRTRIRAGAPAPAALHAAAPAAVLAAAPAPPPAAPPAALLGVPPAGFVPNPVAPVAPMFPDDAALDDVDEGDPELFVMQDEH